MPTGLDLTPSADTKGPKERLAYLVRLMCRPLGLKMAFPKPLAYASGNGCAARWAKNHG